MAGKEGCDMSRGNGVFYNICPVAGCHQYCPVRVYVKDGKIVKVAAAEFPDDPIMSCICQKGIASVRIVYHPERLRYPMRRKGPRGSGEWERISWDEALDAIAGKLLEIKEKYGSRSVMIIPGGSSTVGTLARLMGMRFANLWGAGGGFEGKGWASDGGLPAASLLMLGDSGQGHHGSDYSNAKLLILWGKNPAETAFREMRYILEAKERGTKLVAIGPVFDTTAAKADRWIPVRLGTDSALALSMMNVIIEKKLYDKDFIANYTVGPFLVREDDKLFLRQDQKYMVWDTISNSVRPSDSAGIEPAILGTYHVDGIRCKTAFQLLADRAAQYPPAKASEITNVAAETIRDMAIEYATTKPAAIVLSFGVAYTYHGNLGCRAAIALAAITGNIGIPGGGASVLMGRLPFSPLNIKEVAFPQGAPGVDIIPNSKNSMRGWAKIAKGEPYPIKAVLIFNQNPVHNYGNAMSHIDIFSKMELVVVCDIFLGWTARYADIILPEAITYERSDVHTCLDYLVRMQKAVEPIEEAKAGYEIWAELAQRVGLGQYFRKSPEDFIRMLLNTEDASVKGITLERLDEEGIVRLNHPFAPYIPFQDKNFPTPSGRIEFYIEPLIKFGEELPLYKEQLESPRTSPLAKKYPLSLFTKKKRFHMNSICANIDWMLELDPEPYLDINPKDAQQRQIDDGDMVVVFNDRGRCKLKARLNQAIPPGSVNIDHGWWPDQFADGHYNLLLRGIDDEEAINPALELEPIVKDSRASAHLIYFDCLVEVKKEE